jgi:hypothetical protein
MSIFKKANNETAYLKCGILGFQGSGKTYTAVDILIGLHKFCNATKPIYFLDTETGSDWAIQRFLDLGIELRVAKTRAFRDLLDGIREAEQEGFGLIIDSVSHYWTEMIEAYKTANHIGPRMAFHHWGVLKPEWSKFSNAYVNSKLHCIVCGRAGWEWGHEDDEEGHKELMKLGTKMKVEGEFSFEPSLLLEMERVKEKEVGGLVQHRCTVIKDRRMDSRGMDGKEIMNPKFEDFMPHIECLNLGGEHIGVDATANSQDLFTPKGESYPAIKKRKETLIEEIDGELEMRFPGTAKEQKLIKLAMKKYLFGTYSDVAIADLHAEKLEQGKSILLDIFACDDWIDKCKKITDDQTKAGK